MLDANTFNQAIHPPTSRQQDNPQPTVATVHAITHMPANNPTLPVVTTMASTKNTLPRFAQVAEAANLRQQAKPKRTPA
jgi:TusA-related sulfurtransferase